MFYPWITTIETTDNTDDIPVLAWDETETQPK